MLDSPRIPDPVGLNYAGHCGITPGVLPALPAFLRQRRVIESIEFTGGVT